MDIRQLGTSRCTLMIGVVWAWRRGRARCHLGRRGLPTHHQSGEVSAARTRSRLGHHETAARGTCRRAQRPCGRQLCAGGGCCGLHVVGCDNTRAGQRASVLQSQLPSGHLTAQPPRHRPRSRAPLRPRS